MKWIKLEEQTPTEKDMPFMTYGQKLANWPKIATFHEHYEIWDDSDWFFELDDQERNEWIWWAKLEFPKKR